MLISVERLLVRLRHVPSRAEELLEVRARLRREIAAAPGEEEQAIAVAMRALKVEISAALTQTASCHTCATGRRAPRGTFAGGDCCAGVTADLFDDDEVAALAQAGTRPRHLTAPRDEHAGCAFRGSLGCTLEAVDRPMRCVHYTCMILRRELRAQGELAPLDVQLAELKRLMARFVELRGTRLDDELLAPLEQAIDANSSARAAASSPAPR